MESQPEPTNPIKLLCSYGGKILPRLSDGTLRYSGGHTRVLSLHPSTSFSELMEKLGELCGSSSSSPVTLKCPLPNGDLETLISITTDEDLANIIQEYGRASSSLKIRAILSPAKKLSSPPPSSPSSASHSPSGSPHASAYSPSYRLNRHQNCSQVPFGYPIGVGKGCWYTRQLDGSPRLSGSPLQ